MKNAKLIEEYKLQRKATIDTRNALYKATQKITSVRESWQEGIGPYSFDHPNGKCIQYTIVNYTDGGCNCDLPVTGTIKRKKYCSDFKNGCKYSKCKTYEDYLAYSKALCENEIAEQKLAKYPLWVRFLGIFQRS